MLKKEKISENKKKVIEILTTFFLIIFALVAYFTNNFLSSKNRNTKNIAIYVDGQQITEVDGVKIDISKDSTFVIGDKNIEYNTIEIKDGKVRCIDSNCPNKVCVNHGYLNPDIDNDMIICAPHKLAIQYN